MDSLLKAREMRLVPSASLIQGDEFERLSTQKLIEILKEVVQMAVTTIDIGTLITRTPGLHGSSPHILGKGVTVRRIVSWYKRGLSPEEIGDSEALLLTADRIGHLTLAEVYAALTYYHANTAEVEADIAQQTAEAKRLETAHQSVSMSME